MAVNNKTIIKKRILMIFMIFLILAITAFFLMNGYINSVLNKMIKEPDINKSDADIANEVTQQNQIANVVNIVVFGADNDGNKSDEVRSDAIKIISIDLSNKEIKITSLERDLVVWIPGDYQQYGHLNWAFWVGDAALAVKTINYNFDMDITQYVSISFDTIEKVVDLIDGVDIALTNAEVKALNLKSESSGIYTLNGKQALAYSRIRKIDDDYHRMARQQNVIQAIVDKTVKMSKIELFNFISDFLPYVTTNLTNSDIKNYALTLMSYDLDIKTLQIPSGGYQDTCNCSKLGGYLVTSYQEMSQEMHDFIYGLNFYSPSQNLLTNEKNIYEKYGECNK